MTRALLVYLSAKSLLNRERFSVLNRLVKGYHYFLLLITLFILSAGSLFSQEGPDAYIKTITDRSVKIVNSLSIKDSVVYNKVVAQLVAQYSGLNKIQEENKALMIAIKQSTATTDTSAVLLKNAEEKKSADLKALHQSFISGLRQWLNTEQVDLVKDGMTYRVFPITFAAYQDMIPTLTEAQKTKIYEWLKEAREIAMDAESSDKKHAVFGKYKGRINNYLSAEGYDLKKATEEWQQRIKERNKPAQS
jgi:Protein of unknown function (DUF3826)